MKEDQGKTGANGCPGQMYSWHRLFLVFGRIGLLSFGGPAAQIALMHRVLVVEEKWLDESRFLSALSFCMLLPGPEAMQLATYSGWRLRGISGGLLAGLLFVIPGALVVLGLAVMYMAGKDLPVMTALFLGIKGAVLVIVVDALLKVARKALHSSVHWAIAGVSFVSIFFLSAPFPLLILVSGLVGFFLPGDHDAIRHTPVRGAVRLPGTIRTVGIWLAIWLAPLILLAIVGGHDLLVQIGSFFSRLAVVTFGGAYAVLGYLAQDAVASHGWLSAREMMDGLGLAETTPGPLILVTEFVGYIAGYRYGGLGWGIAGAAVTLWVTFVPCFLWIFAGAPYLEQLIALPRLKGALVSITAAVVGVILNLFIWFSLHVLFSEITTRQHGLVSLLIPEWSSLNWRVLIIGVASGVILLWWRRSLLLTLAVAALLGVVIGQGNLPGP